MRQTHHPVILVILFCTQFICTVVFGQDSTPPDGTIEPSSPAQPDVPVPDEPESPPEPKSPAEPDVAPTEQPEEVPPTEEPPPAEEPPSAETPTETPGAEAPAPETVPPSLSEPLAPAPNQPPAGVPAPVSPAGPLTGITTVPVEPLPVPPKQDEPAPVPESKKAADEINQEKPVAPEPAKEDAPPKAVANDTASKPASDAGPVEKKPFRFASFSFSPQIGYSFFPESNFEYDNIKLKVDNRNSFVLKLHLDMGGDGLAFELTPFFANEKIGGDLSSFGKDLAGGVSGSFHAVGSQIGIAVRGSWGSFYPHIGIGFHSAFLFGDSIEYGAELYGRIPLGFTWYVAKHLGLVMEFAFMYGATGIRGKMPDTDDLYADLAASNIDLTQEEVENIDWTTMTPEQFQSDYGLSAPQMDTILEEQIAKVAKFGKGYAFELMFGIRFP